MQQCASRAERIERAAFYERFERFFIEIFVIYSFKKIGDTCKLAALLPLGDYFADFFDVPRVGSKHARHVDGGEVGLHVSGLIGNATITRGVCLSKSVCCKWFNQFP